jgi:MFS family permease
MTVRSFDRRAPVSQVVYAAQEPHAHVVTLERVGRLVDAHAVSHTIMVQLTGGVFLTAFALALGASPLLIGVLAALPFIVKLSQLYLSWRIEKLGHWRRTAFRGALFGRTALLFSGVVPLAVAAATDGPAAAWVLAAIIAAFSLGSTVYELGYLTWLAELIPESRRGEFWGRRGRLTGLTALVMGVIAAAVLQRLQGGRADPAPFGWLYALGAATGLAGLLFLRRVPDSRRQQTRLTEPEVGAALAKPLRDRNYRWLLGFIAWWGFAGGLVAPFFTVFMLQDLGLPILGVTLLTTITGTTMSLVQLYWGRLGDRFGAKTVLRTGTYLVTLVPLLWLLVDASRIWLIVVIQLVAGLGWGAYHLSLNNLILKIAPAPRRASYLATFGAVNGTAESVAPIAGGALLVALQAGGLASDEAFRLMTGLSLLLFATATPVLAFVHEEGASSVGRMIRVLGRFRSMDSAFPQGMLFENVYTHVARLADLVARERRQVRR